MLLSIVQHHNQMKDVHLSEIVPLLDCQIKEELIISFCCHQLVTEFKRRQQLA